MKTWKSRFISSCIGTYFWNYIQKEDGTIIRNRVFLNNKDPYGKNEEEKVFYRKDEKKWVKLIKEEN